MLAVGKGPIKITFKIVLNITPIQTRNRSIEHKEL